MSYNILIIAQAGRLEYEALLFVASLRQMSPNFSGRIIIGEPQSGEAWSFDPRMKSDGVRGLLEDMGAEIRPFENRVFGESYPNGNKIEGLSVLPEGEPFVFFDTDTLVTGPLEDVAFDFDRPSASLKREPTWPKVELYGPSLEETWRALYEKFEIDFEASLKPDEPELFWERYLYFNAGWFFYRCPKAFQSLFLRYAQEIRDAPPETLVCQELFPWLDQIALPLVITQLGGGRVGPHTELDGGVTCHWRVMSLLFARESDHVVEVLKQVAAPNKIKQVLKEYEPFKRLIYQPKGQRIRDMFDRDDLPRTEQKLRGALKRANLWMR